MRLRIAMLCAWLAVACQACCPGLSEAARPRDPSLQLRKQTVRFRRATRKLFERPKASDPSETPFEAGKPPLPSGVGCLSTPLALPKAKLWVTSTYRDSRHPFVPGYHSGTDLGTPVGTPILAATSGKVVSILDKPVEDNYYVVVDFGEGWSFRTVHMSKIDVAVGDTVQRGEMIGLSGGEPDDYGSGEYTTGPHLHFDLIHHGAFVNAQPYFCEKTLRAPPSR